MVPQFRQVRSVWVVSSVMSRQSFGVRLSTAMVFTKCNRQERREDKEIFKSAPASAKGCRPAEDGNLKEHSGAE